MTFNRKQFPIIPPSLTFLLRWSFNHFLFLFFSDTVFNDNVDIGHRIEWADAALPHTEAETEISSILGFDKQA